MKRLYELADMLTKATGIKHSFAGCNGMYYCTSFSPFHYLNGAHNAKDICLYLEAVLSTLEFIKYLLSDKNQKRIDRIFKSHI